MIGRPPRSTLFPNTPLFGSVRLCRGAGPGAGLRGGGRFGGGAARRHRHAPALPPPARGAPPRGRVAGAPAPRSEEHTSELQSRQYLVCRLLLEKKKKETSTVTPAVHPFPLHALMYSCIP